MDCERVEELLSSYVEGELVAEERRLFELHLGSCTGCRGLLAALGETRSALGAITELEVGEPLRARLRAIPAGRKRFSFNLDFLVKPSLQPAFGAAAIVMTLVSFYLFGPYKADVDRTVDRAVHQGYSQAEKLFVKAGLVRDRLEDRTDSLLASLKNLELFEGSQDQTQR